MPLNTIKVVVPRTFACRVRKVVIPKEPFSFAYVSLPTRACVRSSNRIAAAITFSRGIPSSARSRETFARTAGNVSANDRSFSNFNRSRTSRKRAW